MDKDIQFNENVKKQIQNLFSPQFDLFQNSQDSLAFLKDLNEQVKEAVSYLSQMDKQDIKDKKKKKSKLFTDIPISQSKIKQLQAVRSNRENVNIKRNKIKAKSKSRSRSTKKINPIKKVSSQILNISNNKSRTPTKKPHKGLDIIEEKPTTNKKLKNQNTGGLKKKMSVIMKANSTLKGLRNSKSQRNSLTRLKKPEDNKNKSSMDMNEIQTKKEGKKIKKKKTKQKQNKKAQNSVIKGNTETQENKLQNLASINSLKKEQDEKEKPKKILKKKKTKVSKKNTIQQKDLQIEEDEQVMEVVEQQQNLDAQEQINGTQNETQKESIVQLPESKLTADFEQKMELVEDTGRPTAQFYESEDIIIPKEDKNEEEPKIQRKLTNFELQKIEQEGKKLKKRMLESIAGYFPIQPSQVFQNMYFAKQYFKPYHEKLLEKQNKYTKNQSEIDLKISELGVANTENQKLYESSQKTKELLENLDDDLLNEQIKEQWSHHQVKDFFVLFYLLANSQKISDELPDDDQTRSYFVYFFNEKQYEKEQICELGFTRKLLVEDYLNTMKRNNYLHQSTLVAYGNQFKICWSFVEDLLQKGKYNRAITCQKIYLIKDVKG